MGRLAQSFAGLQIQDMFPYVMKTQLTLGPSVSARNFPNADWLNTQDHPFAVHRMTVRIIALDSNGLVLAAQPDIETREAIVLLGLLLQGFNQPMTKDAAPVEVGNLLGGTTVSAGTGGEQRAREAELYILALAARRVIWHAPVLPGAREYTALCALPDGRVLGVADQRRLFAFAPAARHLVCVRDLEPQFGPTPSQQGPRVFVCHPQDGRVFLLLRRGIAQVDARDCSVRLLAEVPVPIGAGGDYLDGRIYFGSGSHLYSCEVPAA